MQVLHVNLELWCRGAGMLLWLKHGHGGAAVCSPLNAHCIYKASKCHHCFQFLKGHPSVCKSTRPHSNRDVSPHGLSIMNSIKHPVHVPWQQHPNLTMLPTKPQQPPRYTQTPRQAAHTAHTQALQVADLTKGPFSAAAERGGRVSMAHCE